MSEIVMKRNEEIEITYTALNLAVTDELTAVSEVFWSRALHSHLINKHTHTEK